MPVNPRGSLGKSSLKKVSEKVKSSFLVYSFFVILVLEILSILVNNNVNEKTYTDFYYPIFTNLDFAILFANFYFFRKRLNFCFRKKIAVVSLTSYYLFNALAVIFHLQATLYYALVSYFLLGVVLLALLLTLYHKKNVR